MEMEHYKELLSAVRREFSRFRAWCALTFAVVMIGVICAGMFWPKAYQSSALIYIDSANIIEPLLRGRTEISNIDRAEQAEKLIYTRSVLTDAAREIGLLSEDTEPRDVKAVVDRLRQSVTVEAEGENFFRVSYWDKNPDRSYDVVNTVVKTFINSRSLAQQTESSGAYDFINSQVRQYEKQLAEAERKLREHKAKSPDTTEAAVKDRIAQIRTQIQDLRVSIQETESTIATTRQLLQDENSYLSAQSELSGLFERKRALEQQLAELRLAYQESYPDIVAIKGQLRDIEEELQARGISGGSGGQAGQALYGELRSQLSVAEVDLKSQKRRMQSLQQLLEEQYVRLDKVANAEAQLEELQRDYQVVLDVYEELLSRQESAKMSIALNTSGENRNYEIIEEPVYPLEPGGPQFVHFAVAAPILGLGAPFALLVAFIMADPRIRSTNTLTQSTPPELELLGVVPHFRSPAEKRAARAEIAMLTIFCAIAIVAYGLLVYAGFTGLV